MKRQLNAAIAIGIISYFGACAPVKFEAVPEPVAKNVVTRCEGNQCFYDVTEERTVGEGLVDILIVNDNSGSMSPEQAKMGSAFSGFLSSIQSLDYRISMVTTDIAGFSMNPGSLYYNPASPYNGNGALQDGKLIEFAPGLKYLERSTPNKETLFDRTIKRDETLNCEASSFTQCPSGDERGIYAANLSIQNYASLFIRPTAHLAVIVLSDEDERGVSKYNPATDANAQQIKQLYPLEALDEPSSFVETVRSKYPEKTMSWHSIIIKDGDYSCLAKQNGQLNNPWVRGAMGSAYQKLTSLTGGVLGDICADNYTEQLKQIGFAISNQVTSLPFQCRPKGDAFTLTFNGQEAATSSYSANFNTMVLSISQTLSPSTKVVLKYTCVK